MDNPMLKGNHNIEKAIAKANASWNADTVRSLVKTIQRQMKAGRQLLIPIEYLDPDDHNNFRVCTVTYDDNEHFLACYTSEEELRKGPECGVLSHFIDGAIEMAIDQENISGMIINPFGVNCCLPKHLLWMIYDGRKPREDDWIRENYLLEKAIRFATDCHAGQVRKGTHIPYIVHPLETMNILRSMNADTNLLIAGVLHDTIEDTEANHDDILARFGTDVVSLVDCHSEDKSKTWEERKTRAIQELAHFNKRLKMLVMADKVSNLRSIAADYKALGDELWSRFNAPKEKQAWYYSGIQDALWDMQLDPDTSAAYWEMIGLYKDVFVRYYRSWPDEDYFGEHIVQDCADGSIYRLDRGSPEWKPMKEFDPRHASCVQIRREDAERLEDEWNKPFWEQIERDLADDTYNLVGNREQSVGIILKDGKLTLNGEDYEPACESINGKDEYEYHISLDEDNTKRLLVQMRMEFGTDESLLEVFQEMLGDSMISSRMMKYCKKKKVKYSFVSI